MAVNKNKVQLQETVLDSNGHPLSSTDVNPLTSSDCVIMENGMTLEDIMGNETVSTPTIMNEDTSFKVGVGDSEAKVVDSDVAKMVFEGKSYQNILPKPTTLIMNTDEKEFKINDKIDSSIVLDDNVAEIATVKGQTYVNVVQEESASEYVAIDEELNGQSITTTGKPEGYVKNATLEGLTLVNIIQESSETEVTLTDEGLTYPTIIKPSTTYTVQLKQTTVNSEFPLTINLGGTVMAVSSTKFTITTPSELTSQDAIFTGKNNVISEVVITEGDTTGIEYDFFEGMNDVKSPKLLTTGKNLCYLERGYINPDYGTDSVSEASVRTNYVQIDPTKRYVITGLNKEASCFAAFYDINKNFISRMSGAIREYIVLGKSVVPSETKYVRVTNYGTDASLDTPILFEKTDGEATSYEPYKGVTIEQSIDSIPLTSDMFEQNAYITSNAIKGMSLQQIPQTSNTTNRIRSKTLIKVKPNATYQTLSSDIAYSGVAYFDKNGAYIGVVAVKTNNEFKTDSNTHYVVLNVKKSDDSDITPSTLDSLNLTLQEVTDEIVLRSIGDVKDTLNLTTGEYVQRIGEIIIDGSEGWQEYNTNVVNTYCGVIRNDIITDYKGTVYLNNKLNKLDDSDDDIEGIRLNNLKRMFVRINRNKGVTNLTEFKQYISQNPLTVQYELATPIIKKVNLTNTTKLPSYASTTHYDTIVPSNSLVPNIKIPSTLNYNVAIKPSTQYTIRANTTSALSVNLGGSTGTLTDGKVTLTTPSTLAHNSLKLGNGKAKEVMVIEGNGIKDNVPFFNGMKNVQMGGIKLVNIARGAICNSYVTANANKTQFTYTADGTNWGKIQFDKALLKPNTKYTIRLNVVSNCSSIKVQLGHAGWNYYNINNGVTGVINGTIISPPRINCDVPSSDSNYFDDGFCIYFRNADSGQQSVISNPMIIEGDWIHLDEIPYIESEMIIEQPIIRSQGKNLFNIPNQTLGTSYGVTVKSINGKINILGTPSNNYGYVDVPNFVQPNKTYTYSVYEDDVLNTNYRLWIRHDDGGVLINPISGGTFTTRNTAISRVQFIFENLESGTPINKNVAIQLEEGTTATTYEPYKHQTLYSNRVIGYEEGVHYGYGDGVKYTNANYNSVMADVEGLSIAYVANGSSNFTFWEKNGVFISGKGQLDTALSSTDKNGFIQVPSNAKYMKFASSCATGSNTDYTKATVTGELPLRSLPNGVCDTLNLVTGEYVQRVGEIVLDGSSDENWIDTSRTSNNNYRFGILGFTKGGKNDVVATNISCDTYIIRTAEATYWESHGMSVDVNGALFIYDKMYGSLSLNAYKQYLSQNPITVQYELATPIIRKIGLTAKGNYKEVELNGGERVGQNPELSKKFHVYDLNLANDGQQFTLFTNKEQFTVTNSAANYTVYKYKNGADLVMIINENINTVDLFKRWLSQNPIKVSYLTNNSASLYSNIQKPIFFNDVKVQFMNDNVDIQPTLTLQSRSTNSYEMDMMKANTKYTLKALANPNSFTIDGTSYSATTNGAFTSPSTLTNKLLITGQDVQELMIIEGDITSKQLPYYKGIRSSFDNTDKVEVFVRNKNLVKELYPMLNNNTCVIENGVITIKGNGDGSGELKCVFNPSIYLEKDKTYTFSFSSDAQFGKTNGTDTVEAFLLKDGGTGYYIETYGFTRVFTCGATGYYNIRLDINKNNTTHKFYNIQIEESPTATPYQPHKENSTIINMPMQLETVEVVKPVLEKGSVLKSGGTLVEDDTMRRPKDFIPVQPNINLTFMNGNANRAENVIFYDIDKNYIGWLYTDGSGDTYTPKDCYFIKFYSGYANTSDITVIKKQYKPIALNELPNGVKDELIINRATSSAKLIQRVGKVVLDGSENWWINQYYKKTTQFIVSNFVKAKIKLRQEVVCDKFQSVTDNYVVVDNSVWIFNSNNLVIHHSSSTINQLKDYLQQNPLTVYYELAEPVITEIRLKGYPFVYEDGSISLNTDIAPVTRTSYNVNQHQLINSQNETIIRHDKQISDLYDYIEIYLDEIYRMELFKMQLELSL